MAAAQVCLAVLAGGRSRRMGHDKAFAELGGMTLIERVRDRLAPAFEHTFVVAKDAARFRDVGLPVIADVRPEDSPTVGVYSAVLASPTPRVLCLGVDLPFVTRELLVRLAELSDGHEAFVPRDSSGVQPLCAVYARATLPALEQMLDRDERRLDLIFDRVCTGYLDVRAAGLGDPDALFVNVNTRTDLERARLMARAESPAPASAVEPTSPVDTASAIDAASLPPTATGLPPSPRVKDFVRRVPLPTVSIVGKKKSGKTTLLVGVIAELVRRGRRVAAIKNDQHGFSIDVPGTDSYALRAAGADVTAVASPEHVAIMSRVPQAVPLLGLVWRLREPVDVVLTEGFARQPAPKIEVSRAARSRSLIAPPDELLAVVTDQQFAGYAVPNFGLDDHAAVADLVEAHMAAHRRRHSMSTDDAPTAAGEPRAVPSLTVPSDGDRTSAAERGPDTTGREVDGP